MTRKIVAIFALGGLVAHFFLFFYHAPQLEAFSTEETSSKMKTTKFFIFQNSAVLLSPTSNTAQFTVFVGEQSPIIIKDAYIEVRGVTQVSASQNITVDINQTDSFPTVRERTFVLDSSGKPNYFRLLYTGAPTNDLVSYLAGIITAAGSYNFYLKVGISGANISLLQARMVITYAFTPPSGGVGGFLATGNVVSSTYDTNAVNGATYNSILWKGTKPVGTKVKLQLASSINSEGPFNFIGGTTCTSGDYYEPLDNQAVDIKCFSSLNNKRYFRYKAILCSSSDCVSSGGSQTPQIDDVIVNWSP